MEQLRIDHRRRSEELWGGQILESDVGFRTPDSLHHVHSQLTFVSVNSSQCRMTICSQTKRDSFFGVIVEPLSDLRN